MSIFTCNINETASIITDLNFVVTAAVVFLNTMLEVLSTSCSRATCSAWCTVFAAHACSYVFIYIT